MRRRLLDLDEAGGAKPSTAHAFRSGRKRGRRGNAAILDRARQRTEPSKVLSPPGGEEREPLRWV